MIKIRPLSLITKCKITRRLFGTNTMKVAVIGAAGKTGTSLSMFLKQSPLIEELSLYDIKPMHGIDYELNSIDTACRVTSFSGGEPGLKCALQNAKVVLVVAAASPDKMKGSDELTKNASIIKNIVSNVITYCPTAMLAIGTSPVNSLVPIIVELYKKAAIHKYNHIFGVTTLSCMKANVFLAEHVGIDPEFVTVPVIGGECRNTCVPVFSQAMPKAQLTNDDYDKLVCMMKKTFETTLQKRDSGCFDSCLAMGFAMSRFCISLVKGLLQYPGVVEYAFVRSNWLKETPYFGGPIELGTDGVKQYLPLPTLTIKETFLLDTSKANLKVAIRLGEKLSHGKFDKIVVPLPPPECCTETPPKPPVCKKKIKKCN